MARKPMSINITNAAMVASRLEVAKEDMNDKVADALRKAGGEVERRAVRKTPLDTGELRRRAFSEGPLQDGDNYIQVVGYEKHVEDYDNRYAVPVHEETYISHRVGESKFLEKAVNEFTNEFARYIQGKIRGGVL